MISAILLTCGLLATMPDDPRGDYQAEVNRAGRDPDANVRLALWCEARGLEAERLKHLSLAVLADPSHARARALLGMVSEAGRWARPDVLAARTQADPVASALRLEYETRRNKAEATADSQWQLARWAESVGLAREALAHDTAVTRLDPSRDVAWRKIGCVKFEGRWMSPEGIDALKLDREAQGLADKRWLPLLDKWKTWLTRPARQAEVEEALLALSDPRATPSIWKVFVTANPKDQGRAVRLFGQIDSTDASRRLAMIALYTTSDDVRRQAIETLRGRDLRGVLDLVIHRLRNPIRYQAKPNMGPDSPGVLLIEGKDANLERIYPIQIINNLRSPTVQARLGQILDDATDAANRRFLDDVAALEATNADIETLNKQIVTTLKGVTGKDFGLDRDAWLGWWTDRQGYAFKASNTAQTLARQTITEYVEPYAPPRHSCFAAGTPVQTLEGPRAIETLRAGDPILSQDTASGVLSYQPALTVFHNPPADTLRIKLAGETIVATGIHRFWKAGQGWVQARELKPGDPIRLIGGTSPVESIEPDKTQPVFNLEVARGTSFFVGRSGALVHDNSLIEAVEKPFDALPVGKGK